MFIPDCIGSSQHTSSLTSTFEYGVDVEATFSGIQGLVLTPQGSILAVLRVCGI